MTGWRIGFVVGNRDAVQTLARLKTNIDSGVFQAVQWAAIEALRGDQSCVEEMKSTFQRRRDLVVRGLRKIGLSVRLPRATFYIWAKVPEGMSSSEFCEKLLEEKGIVVTPGSGFGEAGEGYFRISLTTPTERLQEAISRWGSAL
jgi:LL-diaminopimelate aminotransferase